MPYRRLPNTDQARMRALKQALKRSENQSFGNQIISFSTILEARNFCGIFETHLYQYHRTLENQVKTNKECQQIVQNARLYISHFIQVFNFSVIRGEIKKENKSLYQLDPDNHTVPDLSTDAAILYWGQCIIDGENERTSKGGAQIYNPSILKVKVHYERFKEYHINHKLLRNTTVRNRSELTVLRDKCDKIILDVWNQVEEKFKDEKDPAIRYKKCQEYGVVYYYRKGEEKLIPLPNNQS